MKKEEETMRSGTRILFWAILLFFVSVPGRYGSSTGVGSGEMAGIMADGMVTGEMAVETVKNDAEDAR